MGTHLNGGVLLDDGHTRDTALTFIHYLIVSLLINWKVANWLFPYPTSLMALTSDQSKEEDNGTTQ
jgi:hypothetical protein